jgi:hypothetical protein
MISKVSNTTKVIMVSSNPALMSDQRLDEIRQMLRELEAETKQKRRSCVKKGNGSA